MLTLDLSRELRTNWRTEGWEKERRAGSVCGDRWSRLVAGGRPLLASNGFLVDRLPFFFLLLLSGRLWLHEQTDGWVSMDVECRRAIEVT